MTKDQLTKFYNELGQLMDANGMRGLVGMYFSSGKNGIGVLQVFDPNDTEMKGVTAEMAAKLIELNNEAVGHGPDLVIKGITEGETGENN